MTEKFSEKQQQILSVAEELIARKGFGNTSVRDISSAAGVNVAMISYYFGSKDQMMMDMVLYRILRAKENLAEFAGTIKSGKPEMQMKELIKFMVSQLFVYREFHAYIVTEIRDKEDTRNQLMDFYRMCTLKIDDIIKKGVALGVFNYAPKAEDIFSVIMGTGLFFLRNRTFYKEYIPYAEENNYLKEVEKKARVTILLTIFSLLGYSAD